jgi:hypothetical protein
LVAHYKYQPAPPENKHLSGTKPAMDLTGIAFFSPFAPLFAVIGCRGSTGGRQQHAAGANS